MTDALKLTTYFGERDRAGDRFLADALADLYARAPAAHEPRAARRRGLRGQAPPAHRSAADALRGPADGLGRRRHAGAHRGAARRGRGAERRRAHHPRARTHGRRRRVVGPVGEEAKLTVHLGRGERADGRPAHIAVVDALHRHGVAGATVLLGVDGTARGERRRARFFAANAQVPADDHRRRAPASASPAPLAELRALPAEPLMTLERVRVCKRDGRRLGAPEPVAGTDPRVWRCGRSSWSTAASSRATRSARSTSSSCAPCARRGQQAPPRCAASGATTATTRPTATASASCAAAFPSSR